MRQKTKRPRVQAIPDLYLTVDGSREQLVTPTQTWVVSIHVPTYSDKKNNLFNLSSIQDEFHKGYTYGYAF